ncbi:MAG: dihydroneopterin aldolase [Bacteroidaceae bacterium]|nr:dihydroneopterin aldolase [Bacteroidaceae bacterium]
MDIILKDIKLYAYHGVFPLENKIGDWYTINLRLTTNNIKSTITDDINDTVNYGIVFDIIKEEMNIPSKLIEHVCGRINQRLLNTFPIIESVTIIVLKNTPPMGANCSGCGVELSTSRNPE